MRHSPLILWRNVANQLLGNFFPMGISVLADQLYGGEFVQLSANDHLRFVDEPAQVEK